MRRQRATSAETVTDRVAAHLRSAILSGALAPNSRVTQDELAITYQVSRTPIRKVLERLKTEGMVVAAGPRTVVVTPMNREHLEEVFQVRIALEQLAIRLAVEHITSEILERLRGAVDRIAALTHEGLSDAEIDELLHANHEFHRATDAGVPNQYLRKAIEQVRSETQRFSRAHLRTLYRRPGRAARELGEHRGILRALEERDDEAAARLVGNHLARSVDDLRELIPSGASDGVASAGGVRGFRRPIPRAPLAQAVFPHEPRAKTSDDEPIVVP